MHYPKENFFVDFILFFPDQNVAELDTSTTKTRQKFSIENVILHPEYDITTRHNDIAIVKLNQEVEWTDAVKPICLPDFNEDMDLGDGYLAGWGYESYSKWANDGRYEDIGENRKFIAEYNDLPKKLLEVKMPILTRSACASEYDSAIKNGQIVLTEKMLCAGGKGKDGCLVRK